MRSRKNPRFLSGTLEHAGLGEAVYFLRKAKMFIAHAQTSLDGLDPLGSLERSNKNVDEIIRQIGEALKEIDASEREIAARVADMDDEEFSNREDE